MKRRETISDDYDEADHYDRFKDDLIDFCRHCGEATEYCVCNRGER